MDGEKRMELEEDDNFRKVRHRYYKLGLKRRFRVLSETCGMPEINGVEKGVEKATLFDIAADGRLDDLVKLIEREEGEIQAEAEEKREEGSL